MQSKTSYSCPWAIVLTCTDSLNVVQFTLVSNQTLHCNLCNCNSGFRLSLSLCNKLEISNNTLALEFSHLLYWNITLPCSPLSLHHGHIIIVKYRFLRPRQFVEDGEHRTGLDGPSQFEGRSLDRSWRWRGGLVEKMVAPVHVILHSRWRRLSSCSTIGIVPGIVPVCV